MDDNGNILRLSDSPVRLTEAYEARIKELEQKLLALLSPSQPAK